MTIPVVSEICSTTRIIRPEPLHAVSNSVTGRRPVRHRWRIIARSVVARTVGGGQRSAYDCPRDKSPRNWRAPSPTSPSPLHGLGDIRDGVDEGTRLPDGCCIGCAGERNDATGEQGRYGKNSK